MSATVWLKKLRDGDKSAANQLFQQYASKLGRYARGQVWDVVGRVADHEDLIQEVFLSFFRAYQKGDYENVTNSKSLCALLMAITHKRAINQNLHWTRDKRGGGKVRGDSALGKFDMGGNDPIVFFERQTEDLLDLLGDETLQEIAVLKLDGHTQDEIAEVLGCTRSTVVRKLERIRKTWEKQFFTEPPTKSTKA